MDFLQSFDLIQDCLCSTSSSPPHKDSPLRDRNVTDGLVLWPEFILNTVVSGGDCVFDLFMEAPMVKEIINDVEKRHIEGLAIMQHEFSQGEFNA